MSSNVLVQIKLVITQLYIAPHFVIYQSQFHSSPKKRRKKKPIPQAKNVKESNICANEDHAYEQKSVFIYMVTWMRNSIRGQGTTLAKVRKSSAYFGGMESWFDVLE